MPAGSLYTVYTARKMYFLRTGIGAEAVERPGRLLPGRPPTRTYETSELGARRSLGHVLDGETTQWLTSAKQWATRRSAGAAQSRPSCPRPPPTLPARRTDRSRPR